jgi:hypothetical protein
MGHDDAWHGRSARECHRLRHGLLTGESAE